MSAKCESDDDTVEPIVVSEETEAEPSFDGLMVGLGVGLNNTKYKLKAVGNTLLSKNTNLFNGVFWLGYGKTFGNIYVGLVFSGDFGKSKNVYKDLPLDTAKFKEMAKEEFTTIKKKVEETYNVRIIEDELKKLVDYIDKNLGSDPDKLESVKLRGKVKQRGFSPALAIRLGYIPDSCRSLMAYLDVGGFYRSVKGKGALIGTVGSTSHTLYEDPKWNSVSGIKPFVRIGLQKQLYKSIAVDLNGEYRFKTKKGDNLAQGEYNEGFSLRLSCIYNCN